MNGFAPPPPAAEELRFSWNRVAEAVPPRGFELFDETLRDGIQAPHVGKPGLEQKLTMIDHMVAAGVDAADLGFPGAGPVAAEECRRISRYVEEQGYRLAQGYAGRTHPDDIAAICELAQGLDAPVDAYAFVGVSPIRQYVEDWSLETIAAGIRAAVAACRRAGVEFVMVLEDASRCTRETLARLYDVAVEEGVRRLTLCDTVGIALPSAAEALVSWTAGYFGERDHPVALEWHGHNDRGLALSTAMAALAAGCKRVHGTVLGIGERTGNASLDQLIVNCQLEEHGHYDLRALRRYCEYAAGVLGVEIPGNYPAMGRDVFKTSAGVHAAAILKAHEKRSRFLEDSIYSSVPARFLGRRQEVLIDPSSGASNVRYWLAVNGEEASDSTVEEILDRAKAGNRPLGEQELRSIVGSAA